MGSLICSDAFGLCPICGRLNVRLAFDGSRTRHFMPPAVARKVLPADIVRSEPESMTGWPCSDGDPWNGISIEEWEAAGSPRDLNEVLRWRCEAPRMRTVA